MRPSLTDGSRLRGACQYLPLCNLRAATLVRGSGNIAIPVGLAVPPTSGRLAQIAQSLARRFEHRIDLQSHAVVGNGPVSIAAPLMRYAAIVASIDETRIDLDGAGVLRDRSSCAEMSCHLERDGCRSAGLLLDCRLQRTDASSLPWAREMNWYPKSPPGVYHPEVGSSSLPPFASITSRASRGAVYFGGGRRVRGRASPAGAANRGWTLLLDRCLNTAIPTFRETARRNLIVADASVSELCANVSNHLFDAIILNPPRLDRVPDAHAEDALLRSR